MVKPKIAKKQWGGTGVPTRRSTRNRKQRSFFGNLATQREQNALNKRNNIPTGSLNTNELIPYPRVIAPNPTVPGFVPPNMFNMVTTNMNRGQFIKEIVKSNNFPIPRMNTKLQNNQGSRYDKLTLSGDVNILDFITWIWLDVKHDRSGKSGSTYNNNTFQTGGMMYFLQFISQTGQDIDLLQLWNAYHQTSFFAHSGLIQLGTADSANGQFHNIYWVKAPSKSEKDIQDKFIPWYNSNKPPDVIFTNPMPIKKTQLKNCKPDPSAPLIPLSLDQTQGPLYTLDDEIFQSHVSIAALADKGYSMRSNKLSGNNQIISNGSLPNVIKYNPSKLVFDIKAHNVTLFNGDFDVGSMRGSTQKGVVTLYGSIFNVEGRSEIVSATKATNNSSSLSKFFGDYIPMLYTMAYKNNKDFCNDLTITEYKNACKKPGGDMTYATGDRMAAMIYLWTTLVYGYKPALAWDRDNTSISYVYSEFSPGFYQFCTSNSNNRRSVPKTRNTSSIARKGILTSKSNTCSLQVQQWYENSTQWGKITSSFDTFNDIKKHLGCNPNVYPQLLNNVLQQVLVAQTTTPNFLLRNTVLSPKLRIKLLKTSSAGINNLNLPPPIKQNLKMIRKRLQGKGQPNANIQHLMYKLQTITQNNPRLAQQIINQLSGTLRR